MYLLIKLTGGNLSLVSRASPLDVPAGSIKGRSLGFKELGRGVTSFISRMFK